MVRKLRAVNRLSLNILLRKVGTIFEWWHSALWVATVIVVDNFPFVDFASDWSLVCQRHNMSFFRPLWRDDGQVS